MRSTDRRVARNDEVLLPRVNGNDDDCRVSDVAAARPRALERTALVFCTVDNRRSWYGGKTETITAAVSGDLDLVV